MPGGGDGHDGTIGWQPRGLLMHGRSMCVSDISICLKFRASPGLYLGGGMLLEGSFMFAPNFFLI